MRISYDLLRDIVKDIIEYDGTSDISSHNLQYDGASKEMVARHVKILIDEGCLKAIDGSTKDGHAYYCIEPTLKGQQFYDATENLGVWNKLKNYFAEHGIEFTVQAAIAVATKFIGL